MVYKWVRVGLSGRASLYERLLSTPGMLDSTSCQNIGKNNSSALFKAKWKKNRVGSGFRDSVVYTKKHMSKEWVPLDSQDRHLLVNKLKRMSVFYKEESNGRYIIASLATGK